MPNTQVSFDKISEIATSITADNNKILENLNNVVATTNSLGTGLLYVTDQASVEFITQVNILSAAFNPFIEETVKYVQFLNQTVLLEYQQAETQVTDEANSLESILPVAGAAAAVGGAGVTAQQVAQMAAEQTPTISNPNNVALNNIPTFAGGNKVVNIPGDINQSGITKNYTNYEYFYNKWNNGTTQRQLADTWNSAGRTQDRGIATLNGRYLVAMTDTYGKVGDNVDVVLDNGVTIPCTIADAKGAGDRNAYGHTIGGTMTDIIEWESAGSQDNMNIDGWRGVEVSTVINKSV